MLGQRRRQWTSIEPTLAKRLVLAGLASMLTSQFSSIRQTATLVLCVVVQTERQDGQRGQGELLCYN